MGSRASPTTGDRRLASGLVHKIRNSLNAMRAHVALLQKFSSSCTEVRVGQQAQKLEAGVVALEELLKEYLAVASPDRDQWQEIELPGLVEEVLQFVALDLEQNHVTVSAEVKPPVPAVYVDRDKLKRAILNLVINARQAMSGGGRLAWRVRSFNRTRVTLEIGDNGSGIPEEERSRIFEPFFTTKPDGLGLGLAVAKRIVEDFNGQISFESEAGGGTTFRITLPTASRQRALLERKARRQQWLQPAS